MSHNEELFYTIAFTILKEIPEKHKVNLLREYKSATNLFQNLDHKKIHWPLHEAEQELKFITKHGIQCFSVLDQNYPDRLRHIDDPPALLYLKGSDNFNLPQLISIIGTRQHTHQVKKVVQELLEGLTHLNIGVISGMALGVDGIAHETALELNVPTWGVLAHGLDTIYPNQHRRLAIKMLDNGGLLTECRQNTLTMPYQFPKRNRIVAGMSDATIVIESNLEGGSMITAKLARDYDREVFAVPGKIHDTKSKGCMWLIKNQIAILYHDPIQLLEDMRWPALVSEENKLQPIQAKIILDPIPQSIFLLIQTQGPVHRDHLATQLGLTNSELTMHLLQLELNGHIHLQAGNLYSCT